MVDGLGAGVIVDSAAGAAEAPACGDVVLAGVAEVEAAGEAEASADDPLCGMVPDSAAGEGDADGTGIAGARITVGAVFKTGRTATVTRRDSSGVHA